MEKNNNHKKSPSESKEIQSWELSKMISTTIFMVLMGFGTYNYFIKEQQKIERRELAVKPYLGEPLRKIHSDIGEWQDYGMKIMFVLYEWNDKEEKEVYWKMFLALMAHESLYNSQARSKTGASGLTQITGITFKDFLQEHRRKKYISRIIKIRDADPAFINKLPNPLRNAIFTLSDNPSDEEVASLVGIFEFFAKTSGDIPWAQIDPHTSVLLGAIVFDIKKDEWMRNSKAVDDVIKGMQDRTKWTKYEWDDGLNVFLKNKNNREIVYALYQYNGDTRIIVDNVKAQDWYVVKVFNDYKNNSAHIILKQKRTKKIKKE